MNSQYFPTTAMPPHQPGHHHVFGATHMNSQMKPHTDPTVLGHPDPSQYPSHSYFSNPSMPHHMQPQQQQQPQHQMGQHPHSQHPQHSSHPHAQHAQHPHQSQQQQNPQQTAQQQQQTHSHHQQAMRQQQQSQQQPQQQQQQQQQAMLPPRKRRTSDALMPLDMNTLHSGHQLASHLLTDEVKAGQSLMGAGTSIAPMVSMMATAPGAQPTTPTHTVETPTGMTPGSDGRPRSAKRSRTNVPWTPAEEMKLKEMRDQGTSWSVIAKSFPNRTEGGVKKHWYKDMHFAKFERDEVRKSARDQPTDFGEALVKALKDYDTDKWKIIGQKLGKPAKACEQYVRSNFPEILSAVTEKDKDKAFKSAAVTAATSAAANQENVPGINNGQPGGTASGNNSNLSIYPDNEHHHSGIDVPSGHTSITPAVAQMATSQTHFSSMDPNVKNADPTAT